jgi:hypothetical protein
MVARWFRVDSGSTNELQPPLISDVYGTNLLNVSFGQINVRTSLILEKDGF